MSGLKPYRETLAALGVLLAFPLALYLYNLYNIKVNNAWTEKEYGQIQEQGMQLTAAIRAYMAVEKHPPESLDRLVPEYLEKLPEPLPQMRPWDYRATGKQYALYCRSSKSQERCIYSFELRSFARASP